MKKVIVTLFLMLLLTNFALAQEKDPHNVKLHVNCAYMDSNCAHVYLRYASGKMIGFLKEGDSYVPITNSEDQTVYIKDERFPYRLGNFSISKGYAPFCELYIVLIYNAIPVVDKVKLVCSGN